jgi:hypothetical protein
MPTDPISSPERRMSKGVPNGGRYGEHVSTAYKLCMSRHKRYGSKNIDQAGIVGILVRMVDKLARLRQFIADGKITLDTPPDEARRIFRDLCGGTDVEENKFEDDLLDVVNYAIIARVWLEGRWGTDALDIYGPAYFPKEKTDA